MRGVSIEMASQAPPGRRWTTAFGIASLLASFGQGFALGTLTSALRVSNGAYAGSAFGAFGWFSALAGVTVTAGYTALGYAYTKQKSSGSLRETAGRRGLACTALTAALLVAALFAINDTAARLDLSSPGRAFAFGGLLLFAAAGATTAMVTFLWSQRSSAADTLPIGGLVVATVSVILALAVARYPVLVPPDLTVEGAVGPHNTMVFILVGIGLNMPLVVAYNVFAHRVFGGKLDTGRPLSEPPDGENLARTGAHS
ncbi:hypothetical protein BCD48_34125 [Pseudofrankia sp. BMG5.36]|nr:hypothetical protein BCD48_34125 [Pseudofrankia sp. BMG5.36]